MHAVAARQEARKLSTLRDESPDAVPHTTTRNMYKYLLLLLLLVVQGLYLQVLRASLCVLSSTTVMLPRRRKTRRYNLGVESSLNLVSMQCLSSVNQSRIQGSISKHHDVRWCN